MQNRTIGERERVQCYTFIRLYYDLYQNQAIARKDYLHMKKTALYDENFILILSELNRRYPSETQEASGDARELLTLLFETGAIDGDDYERAKREHFS